MTDSKKLTALQRESLSTHLVNWLESYAIGVASVEEIDEMNILNASHLAMSRALSKLKKLPDFTLVDGHQLPKGWPHPSQPVIKGDLKCLSIACASILAKVWRDEKMKEYAVDYPAYALEKNAGYPTSAHLAGLAKVGASAIHRKTFKPVAKVLESSY